MPRNPNPQGKGLVPVLQGIEQVVQRLSVPPKSIGQIEMELFTSLFVLQSEIRFNPVIGKPYWLYQRAEGYQLSLIAPEEWHKPMPQRCIGCCVLQRDRTWTLELTEEVANDAVFLAAIDQQRAALLQALENARAVEDVLPAYLPSLGYYGRVSAFILGKSLHTSMQLAGIAALSYEEAAGLLQAPDQ